MEQTLSNRLVKYVSIVTAVIIVVLPFHEFLTTWAASNFGHLDVWRVWKEIVILLMLPIVAYLILKNHKLRRWFKQDLLIKLILTFAILAIGMGIWAYATKRVNKFAVADGLIIDLRFLVLLVLAQVVGSYTQFFKIHWRALLLIPSIGVIVFGLLQLILPIDFLRHFGYGPNTIPAYSTVNQKTQFRRVQSTLRGPNPLGAYLILIIPAILVGFKRRALLNMGLLLGSLIVLYFTYSRSAALGVALAVVLLVYGIWLNKKQRKYLAIGLLAIIACFALFLALTYHNSSVQDVLFHTDNSSKSSSSNAVRFSALRSGLSDVVHQPLGDGPGTAGPASAHNDHPARIAENFYVQIAQELGIEGLVIFMAINLVVIYRLWGHRSDGLAAVLLVSFVGISLVNMVSHAWADDTLSLLWWGFAGFALAPAILKKA